MLTDLPPGLSVRLGLPLSQVASQPFDGNRTESITFSSSNCCTFEPPYSPTSRAHRRVAAAQHRGAQVQHASLRIDSLPFPCTTPLHHV